MLISAITADPSIQPRDSLDPKRLEEFTQILKGGTELTPVTIFCDGEMNWLADGFHRYEAYIRAGRAEIPVKAHKGNLRDAVLCGIRSNTHHGLALSPDERRNAVWRLLLDPEWQGWSSRKIGRICGLNYEVVEKIKSQYLLQNVSDVNRQIHSVTSTSEVSFANNNPETLQNVSDVNRQIHSVINASEVNPNIRRVTRNGKEYDMDVTGLKERSKKPTLSEPSNVIDITRTTQTILEALPPSLNKISGAFCVHKVAFEEPLFSDNLIEWSFRVTTSGPTYGLPYILEMMRSFPLFAQEIFRQAQKLKDQTNGTA